MRVSILGVRLILAKVLRSSQMPKEHIGICFAESQEAAVTELVSQLSTFVNDTNRFHACELELCRQVSKANRSCLCYCWEAGGSAGTFPHSVSLMTRAEGGRHDRDNAFLGSLRKCDSFTHSPAFSLPPSLPKHEQACPPPFGKKYSQIPHVCWLG